MFPREDLFLVPAEHAALLDFAKIALHGDPCTEKAQQATCEHSQDDSLYAQVLYNETVSIGIQQLFEGLP